nr:ribonuclease H-like domain-containing protein [Tanacetum cinerariifolium]
MAFTSSSSSSDNEFAPSPIYDRYQSGDGYHVVPLPYIRTFMPPKPDLDSAPIIEDWAFDSEDESKTKISHNVPSFVQHTKQVKSPRPSVQHVETSILTANPKTAIPKPTNNVKKQKLDEKVEELKEHLQIVPNDDDDDVYTKATPLALKVLVVDYEIYTENNKPYYKIIRADGSNQLFLSFLSLLRNFDREDLEVLWKLVKERFASSKPKNFSDDFLLTTLTYMFENPNVEAQVWKNQKGVHGLAKVKRWRLLESCGVHIITFTTIQMILLVERRYLLTRFTFEQMLNNVRLEVEEGNPQHALKDKGVIDIGFSRHMTGNISYLSNFEELNGGYVSFGGNPKGGKIFGKVKIRTGKLDFDDVYFIKELKFNLFIVSQMCDKKNSVLFTDTECLILSPEFKLSDENQVLLRVLRENNIYNVNLNNIIPSGDLTCLFPKATLDEPNLWHRRLGHINFKTINKLVKGNLVRGLPSKHFENDHTCVACKKGKQHRASCKTKPVSFVNQPLQRLHMD